MNTLIFVLLTQATLKVAPPAKGDRFTVEQTAASDKKQTITEGDKTSSDGSKDSLELLIVVEVVEADGPKVRAADLRIEKLTASSEQRGSSTTLGKDLAGAEARYRDGKVSLTKGEVGDSSRALVGSLGLVLDPWWSWGELADERTVKRGDTFKATRYAGLVEAQFRLGLKLGLNDPRAKIDTATDKDEALFTVDDVTEDAVVFSVAGSNAYTLTVTLGNGGQVPTKLSITLQEEITVSRKTGRVTRREAATKVNAVLEVKSAGRTVSMDETTTQTQKFE